MQSLLAKLARIYPRTLLSEFYRMFGPEATEKLLTVFAGTTLHIPTTRDLEDAQRDVAIWETLSRSKSAAESRRLGEALCKQYKIPRRKMRYIYNSMRRLLKERTKFSTADKSTGQHKIGSIKIRRKLKWRF